MITYKDNKELSVIEYFQDYIKIGESKYELTDTYVKIDMPVFSETIPITIELQTAINDARVLKVTEFQRLKAKNARMELSFEIEVDTGDGEKRKYTL